MKKKNIIILSISIFLLLSLLAFYVISHRLYSSNETREGIYQSSCTIPDPQNPYERLHICEEGAPLYGTHIFTGSELQFSGTLYGGSIYFPFSGDTLRVYINIEESQIRFPAGVFNLFGHDEIQISFNVIQITPTDNGIILTATRNAPMRRAVDSQSDYLFVNTFLDKGWDQKGILLQLVNTSGTTVIVSSIDKAD